MSLPWLEKLANRYASERFDIGRPGTGLYLTRWTLRGSRFNSDGGAVFLHHFHRSDADDALHDHPWPFTSVILAGGYYEHAVAQDGIIRRRWYGPGRVLTRAAEWKHRTELLPGSDCWTLIFRGTKVRSWFFHCFANDRLTGKSVPWRSFVDKLETGALGCGDES